jgi:RimJ/RimL family protein N-acetyltransferase
MSDRILINSEHAAIEIARGASAYWDPNTCTCIARVKDDELMGGILYTSFTGESVFMHACSWDEHWLSRDLLWIAFDFPFRQMHVARVFAPVPEDNWKARRLDENLGFRYVNRVKGVFANNVDCLLMCMERHECRFLNLKPRHIRSNRLEV